MCTGNSPLIVSFCLYVVMCVLVIHHSLSLFLILFAVIDISFFPLSKCSLHHLAEHWLCAILFHLYTMNNIYHYHISLVFILCLIVAEDMRYTVLRIGDHRRQTRHVSSMDTWSDMSTFFVHSLGTDQVFVVKYFRFCLILYQKCVLHQSGYSFLVCTILSVYACIDELNKCMKYFGH